MNARIENCIYGVLCGDALGGRYEFNKNLTKLHEKLDKDIAEHNGLQILGGGIMTLNPGQTTDDSEMTVALAWSLGRMKGYNRENIFQHYLMWHQSRPIDQGIATKMAFFCANNIYDMLRNALTHNTNSLSNGCLMRCAPLGILGAQLSVSEGLSTDERSGSEKMLEACKKDCELTNPHPLAIEAVQVYCSAIRVGILTGMATDAYSEALKVAKKGGLIEKIITRGALKGTNEVELSDDNIVSLDSGEKIGYLGIALTHAFRELMNYESFEKSMERILRYGGDTDTNCCIAGGLLGAVYGGRTNTTVPERWKKTVLEARTFRSEAYPLIDSRKFPEMIQLLQELKENVH